MHHWDAQYTQHDSCCANSRRSSLHSCVILGAGLFGLSNILDFGLFEVLIKHGLVVKVGELEYGRLVD
jgi:hypothetical protein